MEAQRKCAWCRCKRMSREARCTGRRASMKQHRMTREGRQFAGGLASKLDRRYVVAHVFKSGVSVYG
jgi:hypothetical protein